MKKNIIVFIFLLLCDISYGALTPDNFPRVKTGGTSPSLQDSVLSQQNSNVGIGTTGPRQKLEVTGSGIFSVNVGIGTILPSSSLYVAGQAEVQGFKMQGNGSSAGNVLVSSSVGVGTWMSPSTLPGGGGSVTSVTGSTPIASSGGTTPDISIANAAADGSTKGAASFTAADFDASSGNISLDYTNGQAASTSNKGFLTSTDWNTFNNKTSSQWVSSVGTGNVGINTANRSVGVGTFMGSASLTVMPTQDGNKNVGIGTWNPVQALEVFGTIKASTDILVGAQSVCQEDGTNCPASAPSAPAGGTGAVQYNNAGTTAGTEAQFSFNGTNIGMGTTNGINGKLDVRGAAYISGNTGIGDTSPSYKLEVNSADAPIVASFKSTTGDGGIAVVDATGDEWRMFANNNNASFWIYGNGSNRLTIQSAGNVGIGTAVAPSLLYVAGNLETQGLQLRGNGVAAGSILMTNATGIGTWMPASSVGDGAGSGTNYWSLSAGTGNVGISTVNRSVGIGTFMGSGALVIMPPQDGKMNVGIGTWNPLEALEVVGTARVDGFKLDTNPSAGNVLISGSTGIGTWMSTTTIPTSLSLTTTGTNSTSTLTENVLNVPQYAGLFVQSEATGNVGVGTYNRVGIGTFFGNGSLVVMPGNNSGNVGIGTWNPTQALEVYGNIAQSENSSYMLDTALSADGKYSGVTEIVTAGETIAFGDIVYLKAADSQWYLTDADADATAGAVRVAIAVSAGTDNNTFTILTYGKIRADANFPDLTVGAPAYIAVTGGDVVVTQPSGTDDVIRIMGYGNTTNELFFNPSNDYMTHI